MKIGVVLSSGGGRGVFAHTGFLLALQQLGIDITAVAGCSAGALVGGVFASGTSLDQWAERIAEERTDAYWTPDSWSRLFWQLMVRKGRGYTGISDSRAAIDLIRKHLTAQTFETCPIPFYSLAANLTRGSKTLFSSGDLAPRIMASAAMPILYRPIDIDGELFSDGAIIELAPTEAICCRHQLDALIVHHTSVHRDQNEGMAYALRQRWSMLEILYLLLYRNRPWYLSEEAIAVRHCRCGCNAPVIVVEPVLSEMAWPLSKGGAQVQEEALSQTKMLLAPYVNALRDDIDLLKHNSAVEQPIE